MTCATWQKICLLALLHLEFAFSRFKCKSIWFQAVRIKSIDVFYFRLIELTYLYEFVGVTAIVGAVDLFTTSSIRKFGLFARSSQFFAVLPVTVAAAAKRSRRWLRWWLVSHFFVIPCNVVFWVFSYALNTEANFSCYWYISKVIYIAIK